MGLLTWALASRSAAPRVLLDLRESGGIRGFHLGACATLLMEAQPKAEFWAISGDDDTHMELEILRRLSGQEILRWTPAARSVRFSLYVVMSDAVPTDATYRAACRSAGRVLHGLMFPTGTPPRRRRVISIDGHDTAAFSKRIEAELRPYARGVFHRWMSRT